MYPVKEGVEIKKNQNITHWDHHCFFSRQVFEQQCLNLFDFIKSFKSLLKFRIRMNNLYL